MPDRLTNPEGVAQVSSRSVKGLVSAPKKMLVVQGSCVMTLGQARTACAAQLKPALITAATILAMSGL